MSLYIKRAEVSHTEEYIKNHLKDYGIVDSMQFINKTDCFKKQYNGVIVIFKQWNFNNKVELLWNELHANKESPTKIYHGHKNSKFWIVTEYKSVKSDSLVESISEIDLTNLCDKSISILNDLQLKIKLLENKLEKKEQFCMQNEHSRMTVLMHAQGLEGEIIDLNMQIKWNNDDLHAIQKKNSLLVNKNTKLMNENRDLKLAIASHNLINSNASNC